MRMKRSYEIDYFCFTIAQYPILHWITCHIHRNILQTQQINYLFAVTRIQIICRNVELKNFLTIDVKNRLYLDVEKYVVLLYRCISEYNEPLLNIFKVTVNF